MLCLANDSVMSIMMSLWVKIDREVQGYYWKTFSSRNFFIFTASNNSTITQPFSHTFIARQSWPRNKENGFSHSQSLVVSFAADSPFLFIIILRHVYDIFDLIYQSLESDGKFHFYSLSLSGSTMKKRCFLSKGKYSFFGFLMFHQIIFLCKGKYFFVRNIFNENC